MEELNVMKRALRQQEKTIDSQSKVVDGYYQFYAKSAGINEESELMFVVDIDKFPCASKYKKEVYIHKGSDEVDEENNHFAVMDLGEQLDLEARNPKILDLMYDKYFAGVIDKKDYKALIKKGINE